MLTIEVLPEPEGPNSAVDAARGSRSATAMREVAEPLFDVDGQHAQSPWKRMPARRANHSEATSAASEMTIATTTRRQRRGVAAGDLRERVDRGRDGLRLARDVGDEGDGGAELAERLGEAQHHAGDDAGQRERQRDGEEDPAAGWRRASRRRPPAGGRSPRSTAGSRAPAAESPSRRRPAPRRSSGTRTRCRNCRRGTRRSARAGRTRSAADSRSPPAAAPAAGARCRRAATCPRNPCAPAARRPRCRTAAPPRSPRARCGATARTAIHSSGVRSKHRSLCVRWSRRMSSHDVGLIRKVKPYASKTDFAVPERRKAR